MADKVYCGSGKEKRFDDGGSIIEVTIPVDELVSHAEVYGFTASSSGRRMIRLKIGRRRTVGTYGETHTVEVDTWKPGQNAGAGDRAPAQSAPSRYSRPAPSAAASSSPYTTTGTAAYPPPPPPRASAPYAGRPAGGEWPARAGAPSAPPAAASQPDFPDDDDFPDEGFPDGKTDLF